MIRKISLPEQTKILGTTQKDWFHGSNGVSLVEQGEFIVIRRTGQENVGKSVRVPSGMCIIEDSDSVAAESAPVAEEPPKEEQPKTKKKKGEAA